MIITNNNRGSCRNARFEASQQNFMDMIQLPESFKPHVKGAWLTKTWNKDKVRRAVWIAYNSSWGLLRCGQATSWPPINQSDKSDKWSAAASLMLWHAHIVAWVPAGRAASTRMHLCCQNWQCS
jgi:hypothetical protein